MYLEISALELHYSILFLEPVRFTNNKLNSPPVNAPVAMETDNIAMKSDEKQDWLRDLAIIATGPQSPLLDQSEKRLYVK